MYAKYKEMLTQTWNTVYRKAMKHSIIMFALNYI